MPNGWAGFVIVLGNFEGTFYRYAKRYEQEQDWKPPASERLERPKRWPGALTRDAKLESLPTR